MVEGAFTRNDVFQMAVRVAFVSAVTYFSIKWLVNQIDPTSKSRKKAEEKAREQLRKWVSIRVKPITNVELTFLPLISYLKHHIGMRCDYERKQTSLSPAKWTQEPVMAHGLNWNSLVWLAHFGTIISKKESCSLNWLVFQRVGAIFLYLSMLLVKPT